MTAQWYALHSKPMKEALLWEQLCLQQIECYYPCIRVRPETAHARRVKPYFPGYIFGHVDLNHINLSTLQWMPGASSIVSFDGIPASIPDHVIAAIRRHVDEINAEGAEIISGLKPGEEVLIHGGPFDGYQALFDGRLPGRERVRVLLKLMQTQQMALELPATQIQRLRPVTALIAAGKDCLCR
jgi:transcriptional antiterminator RfaH